MARRGLAERPPVEPPRPLRPFLRFSRLPPRGVTAVRRVLDEDEQFRARVADAAVETAAEPDLGRASWLFLTRPDGWEDEVAGLVAEAGEAAAVVEDAAAEQRAERKLRRANERVLRLEAEVADARDREDKAVAELAALRRARHAVVERAESLEALLDAEREVVARLRAQLDAARAAPAPPPAPKRPPPPPPPLPVDVAGVRRALADAAQSARALAASLDEALSLLPADPTGAGDGAAADDRRPPPPPPSRPRRQPARPQPPRRRPLPLPPGVLDDSPEAAEHVVRANGVVLVVDGYNATLRTWPGLPLAEQRHRLVDALAELVARTGADVVVVFDGADDPVDPPPAARPPGAARPPVRVVFSPGDVPADDVILDVVDGLPPHRPVAVASDDREVQAGAAGRGANVLTRPQLFSLLRRGSAG